MNEMMSGLGLGLIHISMGGKLLIIPLSDGRECLFEMHSYHGPIPLNKKTHGQLIRVPRGFWEAFDRWVDGGKKVDGDRCVIENNPE